MERKYYAFISIILIAVIIVSLESFFCFSKQTAPTSHFVSPPKQLFSFDISTLNSEVTNIAGEKGAFDNVSQGTSLQVNLTLTSMVKGKLVVPIDDLAVAYYNSTVNAHTWLTNDNNYSQLQAEAFNYSFSPDSLTLQPSMSNSTIITINLADDAPIGQYSLFVDVGPGIGTSPYAERIGLEMIVTPKAT